MADRRMRPPPGRLLAVAHCSLSRDQLAPSIASAPSESHNGAPLSAGGCSIDIVLEQVRSANVRRKEPDASAERRK